MHDHDVVSRDAWNAERRKLLDKEKEFTRLRDKLSQARRDLPWVQIEKDYVFDSPDGEESLADLFDGRSQLIMYHFMTGQTGNRPARVVLSGRTTTTARKFTWQTGTSL
jgi:predicted dithiol-disulfide oxidoreductase (DUF899 family)